jgi:hypothetical protein
MSGLRGVSAVLYETPLAFASGKILSTQRALRDAGLSNQTPAAYMSCKMEPSCSGRSRTRA